MRNWIFLLFVIAYCACLQNMPALAQGSKDNHFDLDSLRGCFVVKGILQDSIVGQFALDNGFERTLIDSTYFVNHSIFKRARFIEKMPTGMSLYKSNLTIQVNGHRFNIDTICIYNCAKLGIAHLNGIIGLEFFNNSITSINYEQQTLTSSDSLTVKPPYVAIQLLKAKGKMSKTKTKFITVYGFSDKGKKIAGHMNFDLGFNGGDLMVKQSFIKQIRLADTLKEGTVTSARSIRTAKSQKWMLDSIMVGNLTVSKVNISASLITTKRGEVTDPLSMYEEGDGFIGNSFFKRFNIICDYKNNVLYLKPRNNYFNK